jgi:hypothetical protein
MKFHQCLCNDVINSYGGVKEFYKNFYINSPFPLALIRQGEGDGWINANCYDDLELYEAVKCF